ncbi:MAG: M23 family metallopeptidase [Paracoccaceae bacterium]
MGEDCYIQAHVDTDPSEGAADFTCGPLSRDDHQGIDFALQSDAAMRAGVNVVSAAPGTVLRLRDGMADVALTSSDQIAALAGQDCGNAVVIGHGNGWESQYCHMQKGSIAVIRGQRVAKGTVLGKVGLSGRTTFPHVHLSLRKNGRNIDPFNPDGVISCTMLPSRQLWEDPIAYRPTGLIDAGFSPLMPKYTAVTDGTAAGKIAPNSEALVLWAFAFGGQPGDLISMRIIPPKGAPFEEDIQIDRSQGRYFRGFGKRRKTGIAWPTGLYKGEIILRRDGIEMDRRVIEMTVQP